MTQTHLPVKVLYIVVSLLFCNYVCKVVMDVITILENLLTTNSGAA